MPRFLTASTIVLLGASQTISPAMAINLDMVPAIRLEPNDSVRGRFGRESAGYDGKLKGDDWYVVYFPVVSETTIGVYFASDLGEGLGSLQGFTLSIYASYDGTNPIHEMGATTKTGITGYNYENIYGPFKLGQTNYIRVHTEAGGSGDYSLYLDTKSSTATASQAFPSRAIKTLEVVGGRPSTITTDTALKFVATADSSVTKMLFSDNYFFDGRKDLETVTSSNGVFQTSKSFNFSEGEHIIYCFPIDAAGNVVWDNGLGIDEAERSYGAALSVVKATNTQSEFQSEFQGESISVGSKFRWSTKSGVIGYRVYRSESASDEGISITDFYITSTEFVDVNVKPNKTYYYTVRGVIAEAKPFEGIPEQLTAPSEQITVKTPSTIVGDELEPPSPNAVKKFILMTLDDPYMTINGAKTEIDPGRGTTPLLLNSRTMVPIRAIVEGMGGSVGWNEASREVSLDYAKNAVIMTLDKEAFTVNGVENTADVPPTAINGRTMIPIRFAAESLGCAIDWLNSTRQVVIVYY